MKFKDFTYQFDAGPFSDEEGILGDWRVGNCRRMLQWYFFEVHGIFLSSEQILCPDAYHRTGDFVFTKGQDIAFDRMRPGDVIYAERIRSKNGDPVDKSEETFITPDDYIISLYTALYTGDSGKEILHAISIEEGSCVWSLEKFLYFYRAVAVKRIVVGVCERVCRP